MGIFGPVFVNLFVFKVNAMDRGASSSLGPNQHIYSFLSNKQNYGFGEENGDLCVTNFPMVLLNDSDLNDTNSVKVSAI
ncbi:hypothetical protein V7149_14595 [Bacillus sp. JJ1503]|uniref:hypothetical protein n=1 Tax=unclassified Bacillus (in: firmicutes) TaxID=185979 RepID=UPI0030006624